MIVHMTSYEVWKSPFWTITLSLSSLKGMGTFCADTTDRLSLFELAPYHSPQEQFESPQPAARLGGGTERTAAENSSSRQLPLGSGA